MGKEHSPIRHELESVLKAGSGPKAARFALACVSGFIPFAGSAIGAGAGIWSEKEQDRINQLFQQWLKVQEEEILAIGQTLFEVFCRLDQTNQRIQDRLASPAYLALIKKCFRDWSAAESEDKRAHIRNLLGNAAVCSISGDDILRMFIDWIEKFSETHFKVLACLDEQPGSTRAAIWRRLRGPLVRDDSAEADLFKLIIHDLTVGHLIRQQREVDEHGRFVRRQQGGARGERLTSAFDDRQAYVLTELGGQFVFYTCNELEEPAPEQVGM